LAFCVFINLVGLIGLVIVECYLITNIDDFYIYLSGSTVYSDSKIVMIVMVLMIIFSIIFYAFLFYDDIFVVGTISIVALACYIFCSVAFFIFQITILSDQTTEYCGIYKEKGYQMIDILISENTLIWGMKVHGLKLNSLTNYSSLITTVVDENCKLGIKVRWGFIVATFPTFLLALSFICYYFYTLYTVFCSS